MSTTDVSEILTRYEKEILADWIADQLQSNGRRSDRLRESDLRQESQEFLRLLRDAVQKGNLNTIQSPDWSEVREMLNSLSRSRAAKGFSPTETAAFIFSLKNSLFQRLRLATTEQSTADSGEKLFAIIWQVTEILDRLGLYTVEAYQKSREEVILRQQEEMLELSTPVVKLWEGILALPLIGTLDSARTQIIMESLLQAIVDTGSAIAIIDITGVPTVDTLVSQHLLKTVAAARLMGADCIISGIRPQIAQTIVHLGVDLSQVSTKATLADAFVMALQRSGRTIGRQSAPATEAGNRAPGRGLS